MQETRVQSLGQEDPLEREMTTHSSNLAWEISWTEEPDRLQFMGSQRVGHDGASMHSSRVVAYLRCILMGLLMTLPKNSHLPFLPSHILSHSSGLSWAIFFLCESFTSPEAGLAGLVTPQVHLHPHSAQWALQPPSLISFPVMR